MKKVFLVGYDSLEDSFDFPWEQQTEPSAAEAIVVIGGDGAMLHAIQEYRDFNLPFIGLHKGGSSSIGFIMNDMSQENFEELKQDKIQFIESRFLSADLLSDSQNVKIVYAFNDMNFERISTQALKINVAVNGEIYFQPIQCDGILVSTAAGSTAYNANAGGAILPIDSNGLVLTAVAPQRCFGWNTSVLSENHSVSLELMEPDKRPARFVTDGVDQGMNFTKANIYISPKIVKIGFVKNSDFRKKVMNLQFRSQVNRNIKLRKE